MVRGSPSMCMRQQPAPASATRPASSGAKRKAETSFTIVAPASSGRARNLELRGVDRDPMAVGGQRRHHRQHSTQLLLGGTGSAPGPGGLAAHVEDVRPLSGEPQAVLDRRAGLEKPAAVGERVGRDVDDAHQLERGHTRKYREPLRRRGSYRGHESHPACPSRPGHGARRRIRGRLRHRRVELDAGRHRTRRAMDRRPDDPAARAERHAAGRGQAQRHREPSAASGGPSPPVPPGGPVSTGHGWCSRRPAPGPTGSTTASAIRAASRTTTRPCGSAAALRPPPGASGPDVGLALLIAASPASALGWPRGLLRRPRGAGRPAEA